MKNLFIFGTVLLGLVLPLKAASYYPLRLDDPKAVYLTKPQFPVKADGSSDDSAAIQAAIDRVVSHMEKALSLSLKVAIASPARFMSGLACA